MRAYAVCALRPRDTFLPLHHTLQALHPSRLIPSSAIDLLHHNLLMYLAQRRWNLPPRVMWNLLLLRWNLPLLMSRWIWNLLWMLVGNLLRRKNNHHQHNRNRHQKICYLG